MAQAHIDYTLSKFPHERLLEVDEVTARVEWLCTPENGFKTDAVFDLSKSRMEEIFFEPRRLREMNCRAIILILSIPKYVIHTLYRFNNFS